VKPQSDFTNSFRTILPKDLTSYSDTEIQYLDTVNELLKAGQTIDLRLDSFQTTKELILKAFSAFGAPLHLEANGWVITGSIPLGHSFAKERDLQVEKKRLESEERQRREASKRLREAARQKRREQLGSFVAALPSIGDFLTGMNTILGIIVSGAAVWVMIRGCAMPKEVRESNQSTTQASIEIPKPGLDSVSFESSLTALPIHFVP
jgi:hypothetical protein